MSDAERRALEREARYSENLANLLECMREGHVPRKGNTGAWTHGGALLRPCGRCGMGYFDTSMRDALLPAMTVMEVMPDASTSARTGTMRFVGSHGATAVVRCRHVHNAHGVSRCTRAAERAGLCLEHASHPEDQPGHRLYSDAAVERITREECLRCRAAPGDCQHRRTTTRLLPLCPGCRGTGTVPVLGIEVTRAPCARAGCVGGRMTTAEPEEAF